MTGRRMGHMSAPQPLSAPPKYQQPSREADELKDPGQTKAPLARTAKFISTRGDDGADFQKGDDQNEEDEKK